MSVNGTQVREANFDLSECGYSTHSIYARVIYIRVAEIRMHEFLAFPLLDPDVSIVIITDQNLWRGQISIVDKRPILTWLYLGYINLEYLSVIIDPTMQSIYRSIEP